jgi:hypothetical protein
MQSAFLILENGKLIAEAYINRKNTPKTIFAFSGHPKERRKKRRILVSYYWNFSKIVFFLFLLLYDTIGAGSWSFG